MSDSKKTKKELLAEIEALRAKLGDDSSSADPQPSKAPKGGVTRRDVLASAWVAPVILTVPIGAAVSQRAQAQTTSPGGTTAEPTLAPEPTNAPSAGPTQTTPFPSAGPTQTTPFPSAGPTQTTPFPSAGPTQSQATPQLAPTAFPTATPDVIPVELSDFNIS